MNHFTGKWRITWLESWPHENGSPGEPGYFEFTDDNQGEFVCGALRGKLDVRVSSHLPKLVFTWQGEYRSESFFGRGSFKFPDPDYGEGMLYVHCGDESAVKIQRLQATDPGAGPNP